MNLVPLFRAVNDKIERINTSGGVGSVGPTGPQGTQGINLANTLEPFVRGGTTVTYSNKEIHIDYSTYADTYFYIRLHHDLEAGKTYTASFECSGLPVNTDFIFGISSMSAGTVKLQNGKNVAVFTPLTSTTTQMVIFDDTTTHPTSISGLVLKNFKIELGNVQDPIFTPAPEDLVGPTGPAGGGGTAGSRLIPNGTDLNTYWGADYVGSHYATGGNNCSNKPTDPNRTYDTFSLIVERSGLNFYTQFFIPGTTTVSKVYMRSTNGGTTWNDWVEISNSDISNYLSLSGGTMTGALVNNESVAAGQISSGQVRLEPGFIKFQTSTRNYAQGAIRFYEGNVNGSGIGIGDGGAVIVGGGEASVNLQKELNIDATTENLYLASDSHIYFDVNCNTVANRIGMILYSSGNLMPTVGSVTADGVGSIGTSSYKWNSMYANTFYGALNGNASTASALANARTISLTGDVTGSVSFDGSKNVSIATKVANTVTGPTGATGATGPTGPKGTDGNTYFTYGTTAYTAGTTTLNTGYLYFQYE